MSFTFPYQYGFVDNRKIPYPTVTVQLETIRGKRNYSFIMDTGADTLTLNDITPFLLGKENIFDKFNVIFDNDREVTIFEER